MSDRGSACCTRVKKQETKIDNATHYDADDADADGEELLVAIVHPKTNFPGKKLPKGVLPNIYLSRFIAFLPKEPYTIVARSGMFCLGYPSTELDDDNDDNNDNLDDVTTSNNNNNKKKNNDNNKKNPLKFVKMEPLQFANETYNCPKIHFVTGMVDKVKVVEIKSRTVKNSQQKKGNDDYDSIIGNNNENNVVDNGKGNGDGDDEEDAVLISYGVNDCLSRIVEIKKSEIVRMLSGGL